MIRVHHAVEISSINAQLDVLPALPLAPITTVVILPVPRAVDQQSFNVTLVLTQ